MRYNYTKRAFFAWLTLMLSFTALGLSAQTKEISTQEELLEALKTKPLRAGTVENLQIEKSFVVDTILPIKGNFRMFGEPLYRAEGFTDPMFMIYNGGNISFENTLDGNQVPCNSPILQIQEGGSATLSEGGIICGATCGVTTANITKVKVPSYSAAVFNSGTFILDGGSICANNTTKYSKIIGSDGTLTLKKGSFTNNNAGYTLRIWGDFNLYGNTFIEGDIDFTSPIQLYSTLQHDLRIGSVLKEGDIVMEGAGNYKITQADLSKLKVNLPTSDNLSLALKNNQIIVISKENSTITTAEELQEAIDQATTNVETRLIIAEDGISIDKTIIVKTGGKFYMSGGPLNRASNFLGYILDVREGADITIDNTISGKNIENSNPLLYIQNGGKVTLRGVLGYNRGIEHALAVFNAGLFTLNGGIIQGNSGKNNHVIYNIGQLYLTEGKLIDNICDGSVYIEGSTTKSVNTYLASRGVTLGEIERQMFVSEGSPIRFTSALEYPLTLHTNMNNNRVIAVGENNYQLTQNDIENIHIVNGQILGQTVKLENNQAVLASGEDDGTIKTPEELQEAIDKANGTEDNPTIIELEEITIVKPITIEDKYIRFVGGSLTWGGSTPGSSMILINGGGLTIDKTTINGGNTGTGGYRMVSLINIQGGATVTMNDGAILKGAGLTEDVSAVWIFNGNFIMNGGSIEYNYFYGNISMASVISIYKGHFVMMGGYIQNNYGDNFRVVGIFGYTNREAYFEYYGGTIYKNDGGHIDFNGGYWLITSSNPNYIVAHTVVILSTYNVIHLNKSLMFKITFTISTNLKLPNKFALIQGYNYTIKESDLKYIIIPEGYNLVLEDNIIYLVKENASGITTQEELQDAIDNSKGTSSSPEFIDLGNSKIQIYSSIIIKDKYVVLVDGTLVNAASADLRMFDVRSGLIRLAGTVLDGNKSNTHGYCTLIEMNGGTCQIVEDTKLTNSLARGGSEAIITVAHGTLEFNSGTITGNNSEGGDIIWVSGNGKFSMNGGTISGNRNTGRYIMASIEMTNGMMGINSGTIKDNITNGNYLYGIYVTKDFTLKGDADIKEVIILNDNSKLLIPSALKHTVTVGFMKSNMPSGTIVATGTNNYKLTETDVKYFAYRYANKYSFALSDNNIIITNLDAVGRTFTITCKNYLYGTLKTDKTTAKENETVTVTVTPNKGYHVNEASVRYNEIHELSKTNNANVFTFKMPASNAVISAQFLPENITINPPSSEEDFDKEKDPTPDNVITDLPGLIDALGEGNHEITPEAHPVDRDDLNRDIDDKVTKGENNGDDYIGTLEELINIVTKDNGGNVLTSKVIKEIPGGCVIRLYLPDRLIVSEQLRASGGANYYILRECDGEVVTIIPTYNQENNTLTFKTDKMGTFVVMNGKNSVGNENIQTSQLEINTTNGHLQIKGLPSGEYYSIYDLSGKLLKQDISDGSPILYQPRIEGIYIITTEHYGNAKIRLNK